uniref:Uncharacterized protein n=1 Tax=Anopheles dirus TaxID=7168 RepID=A0A182MXH9_9DIPT
MSFDGDDCDEEVQQLVTDSMNLADELITVTASEELARTRHTILKDIETDCEQYGRTIASYQESLERLALLEHGILHGLNKVSAAPAEFGGQLERLECTVDTFGELLRESITFMPPSTLAKGTFSAIGSHREQLATIGQQLERIAAMIDGNQVREVVTTVAAVQRKTNKLMQDVDAMLKLHTLHRQTIFGFYNKICHGNTP